MIALQNNQVLRQLHVNNFTAGTGTFTISGNEMTCTGAGSTSIPQKFAYGTWEFDWYKGNNANLLVVELIAPGVNIETGGYNIAVSASNIIYFNRTLSANLIVTKQDYIVSNVTYRIRITRSKANVFTVYIKGDTFTNWTLVSVYGGSGTNPVTNATYTTSNYFVADLDAGDKIGNITFKPYFDRYLIGQAGEAGIVFYDKGSYSNGWRYLECATADTGNIRWCFYNVNITNANGTSIGTGKQNTLDIVSYLNAWRTARILIANGGTWDGNPIDGVDYTNVQTQLLAGKSPRVYTASSNPTGWIWETNNCADICDNLIRGGKSDWYLPSKDELNLMYTILKVNGIGNFTAGYYWSSTQIDSTSANLQYLVNGTQSNYSKENNFYVRAIRQF
jgi:hypothetical protein